MGSTQARVKYRSEPPVERAMYENRSFPTEKLTLKVLAESGVCEIFASVPLFYCLQKCSSVAGLSLMFCVKNTKTQAVEEEKYPTSDPKVIFELSDKA